MCDDAFVFKHNIDLNSENSLNVSFTSNNSYYNKLNDDKKRDIIFLIKSGYNKRTIIKLYIFAQPNNVNEAIQFLTKENGKYQHIFFASVNHHDTCEVCGERSNVHINQINPLINSGSTISNLSPRPHIINVRENLKEKHKCKICEDEKTNQGLITDCLHCNNYFCYECLYLYIRESIKNGKYDLCCPECKTIYGKAKIEQIFAINNNSRNMNEIINLKKLLEKNIAKKIVLSNPKFIFCPIKDCEGYAPKIKIMNQNYNRCSKGHRFCSKCGELWHRNGKCPEEENVDKLFEEYSRKLNLKKCPCCQIITLKKGGCNHITCTYCKKNWCWLCLKIFNSPDEHYGDENSKCFNMMMGNLIDSDICAKCQNGSNSFKTFSTCGHIICDDCFETYLEESKPFKLGRITKIKCVMDDCNQISTFNTEILINFIKDIDNSNVKRKYRKKILFYKYNIYDIIMKFSSNEYKKYFYNTIFKLYNIISDPIYFNYRYSDYYIFLQIIGYFLGAIFFIIFILFFPFFFHACIKNLYYKNFITTIKKYRPILKIPIVLGEELLTVIFIFPLIACHYIYLLCIPFFLLADFLR